jgi:hypothetical protein
MVQIDFGPLQSKAAAFAALASGPFGSIELGVEPAQESAHAECKHKPTKSMTGRAALAVVCLTVLTIAVAAACSCSPVKLLHGGLISQLSQQQLPGQFEACRQLWGSHWQLCEAYHSSSGEDKWVQAAAWRQASPASCKCCLNDMLLLLRMHLYMICVRRLYSSVEPWMRRCYMLACSQHSLHAPIAHQWHT